MLASWFTKSKIKADQDGNLNALEEKLLAAVKKKPHEVNAKPLEISSEEEDDDNEEFDFENPSIKPSKVSKFSNFHNILC